jgi:hypothetical protein
MMCSSGIENGQADFLNEFSTRQHPQKLRLLFLVLFYRGLSVAFVDAVACRKAAGRKPAAFLIPFE